MADHVGFGKSVLELTFIVLLLWGNYFLNSVKCPIHMLGITGIHKTWWGLEELYIGRAKSERFRETQCWQIVILFLIVYEVNVVLTWNLSTVLVAWQPNEGYKGRCLLSLLLCQLQLLFLSTAATGANEVFKYCSTLTRSESSLLTGYIFLEENN